MIIAQKAACSNAVASWAEAGLRRNAFERIGRGVHIQYPEAPTPVDTTVSAIEAA